MGGLWDGYLLEASEVLTFSLFSWKCFSFFLCVHDILFFFKFFLSSSFKVSLQFRIVLCFLFISCRYSPSAAFEGSALKGGVLSWTVPRTQEGHVIRQFPDHFVYSCTV